MWLEIFLIPFILVIVLFIIFWLVHEGTKWQKHKYLGGFARFIQSSPRRGFLIFLFFTLTMFPMAALVMTGLWWDKIEAGIIPEKSDVVNVMLLMFLVLAFATSILWGSFRTWRHAARAEAEEAIRMTE